MNKKFISKIICLVAILMITLSGTAYANNGENVHPSSQTSKMVSTKSVSLNNIGINPMSLSRPTSGTYLPYNGSFSAVDTEIYSNYYFFTNGATKFYVDSTVTADTPPGMNYHINVYQAGTNKFVLSSSEFNTDSNTGMWTTTFSNLDPAYNYYISFQNDGLGGTLLPISGSFKVRLN